MMIRFAEWKDAGAVYSLIGEMEQSELNKSEFEAVFREQLQSSNFFCWLSEEDGVILGCLNLRIEAQLHHTAKVAEIMELAVRGENRSKGIGTRLFDHACREAKKAGCAQIEVCCNMLRERTHVFYERQGMNRYHYKFSLLLNGEVRTENKLGL